MGVGVRVAVLSGLLVFAVPLTALGLAARPEAEPAPPWPQAAERPVPRTAPARWGAADRDSLAKLREVTLAQTDRVLGELVACEARAGRRTEEARNRAYRRCATPALAWTNGFAAANSRMLSQLAGTAGPTETCRRRVLQLSGTSNSLAFTANTTLRGGLDLPWAELRAASREIRALARETRSLARRPGWKRTCRPRPPARAPAAASKVA